MNKTRIMYHNPIVIRVGASHSITRSFSSDDVERFAKICGDCNPVHLDADAARRAGFPKGRIVHGILVSSLFSTIMGMHLPGPQSIYMQQSLNFRAPVYVGVPVTASVTVTDFDTIKGNISFATTVREESTGALLVDGKALGRNVTVSFERVNADGSVEQSIPSVADRRAAKY